MAADKKFLVSFSLSFSLKSNHLAILIHWDCVFLVLFEINLNHFFSMFRNSIMILMNFLFCLLFLFRRGLSKWKIKPESTKWARWDFVFYFIGWKYFFTRRLQVYVMTGFMIFLNFSTMLWQLLIIFCLKYIDKEWQQKK